MIILLAACTEQSPEEEVTLAQASEQVTFASVENLGPHTYLATSSRTETRLGRELSHHEEEVEIRWEDWDNFAHQRTVDGRTVSEVIVSEGVAYSRRLGGPWKRRSDAESKRVELKTTWNAWEQSASAFGDQLIMTEVTADEIEEREARHFTLSLSAIPYEGDGAIAPLALSGDLWVDEASAVRLIGQLDGVLGSDGYRRQLKLQIARTSIGRAQDITPPEIDDPGGP